MPQVRNKARLSALKFFIEWEIVQCTHWLKMLKSEFASIVVILYIAVAPKFTVKGNKMIRNLLAVPVGNSVKLDCSADGNPRPTVKWYKNGKLFKERKGGNKLYLSPWTTELSLKDLVPSDTGSYLCNVSNLYGWINHTYKVDVHGKDKNNGKRILSPLLSFAIKCFLFSEDPIIRSSTFSIPSLKKKESVNHSISKFAA